MAGTMKSGGGRRAPIAEINVTPMVDVMLVLLVIMIVSAQYIVSQSIKVELPKAASSTESVASIAADSKRSRSVTEVCSRSRTRRDSHSSTTVSATAVSPARCSGVSVRGSVSSTHSVPSAAPDAVISGTPA